MAMFTAFHVGISLVGILVGFSVINGFLHNAVARRATPLFLCFTIATSVTGFGFPIQEIKPPHVVGLLSLMLLGTSVFAYYGRALDRGWRTAYVVTALVAQYFNVFVLVIQSFQKVPALKALAPTQTEAPFAMIQGVVLVGFVALGVLSVKRFKLPTPRVARLGAA